MPIDYSKWDKVGVSSSDSDTGSDDGDDDRSYSHAAGGATTTTTSGRNGPQVTRLANPSSVTLGPGGASINAPAPNRVDGAGAAAATPAATTTTTAATVKGAPERARNGRWAPPHPEQFCGFGYAWGQSRDSITLTIVLEWHAVSGGKQQQQRTRVTAVALGGPSQVSITTRRPDGVEARIAATLAYQVESDEDALDGAWEVVSVPAAEIPSELHPASDGSSGCAGAAAAVARCLTLELRKKQLPTGVRMWWDKGLANDATPIDASAVVDRSPAEVARGKAAQASWEAAHEQFRTKVRSRRSAEEDDGDDVEDADAEA